MSTDPSVFRLPSPAARLPEQDSRKRTVSSYSAELAAPTFASGLHVMKALGLLTAILVLAAAAAGETLRGTVTNGTNGRPGAGIEVTLLSLGEGMTETAHSTTDASGHFHFTYDDSGMPHLVRAAHQGVNYFRLAPPGTETVEVITYDVAKRLDGISTTAEVVRFQSGGDNLQAVQIFAVQNASQPPRTLAGERSYEIELPNGAEIEEAGARAPGGQPINNMPEPAPGRQDHYVFSFPLRPGETQFEVTYQLPYHDAHAVASTTLLHSLQHFVAVLPLSMQFSATGANFAPLSGQKDANVLLAGNVRAGGRLTMTISGTGVLAGEAGQPPASGSEMSEGPGGGAPGGGLGAPIDSPDPLARYRWPVLGGLAAVLVAGGFYVATRRPVAPAPVIAPNPIASAMPPIGLPPPGIRIEAPRSTALLDALKDELFQLEVERQQGRIPEEEYRQTKAGLDRALKRAVMRETR
jgi:hypothetical protein